MSRSYIRIRGARTHNLAGIDLDLPRDALIVFTGLSGSGKSSLAFDTLYAEGQRRYVESLSAYARQFLSMMEKPDVDMIEGLSPAISIEQKTTSHNPRSTVGTVTEINDYLRLLYARAGEPFCTEHDQPLKAQSISQMVDQTLTLEVGTRVAIAAPIVRARKGQHAETLENMRNQGYVRIMLDGRIVDLEEEIEIDAKKAHDIAVIVDRIKIREDLRLRLAESFETATGLGAGTVELVFLDDPQRAPLVFSNRFACPICGFSIAELEPRLFSFNNPAGACSECDGLGLRRYFDVDRVVRHPHLSLAGGAIRGWDRRTTFYFQMVRAIADHYGFDIETPFEQLSESARNVLLFGSGTEQIEFVYVDSRGNKMHRRHAFEGIIPNMQRRYQETESAAVREELGKYQAVQRCEHCHGTRLNRAARSVFVAGMALSDVNSMSVATALARLESLTLPGRRGEIARSILSEICARLRFLADVGLGYLTLERSADTLSGGEAQRIRLASQIGSGLVGVMYILDEPSIGLHQRDQRRLLDTLTSLRDLGNTVIMVEHDEESITAADHVVDLGPGAGSHGGRVVAQGTPAQIAAGDSLTGRYLSGRERIPGPTVRLPFDEQRCIRIAGASGNNLRNISVDFPLGLLTCVTGVSGSGKSTLVNETLYKLAAGHINKHNYEPAPATAIHGLEHCDRVIDISQAPIGRTPRSNPATYTGVFTPIRELFAATQESRARGYLPGRFSFNVKGGRCEECQGDGLIKVEMHFLPDVYVACDACAGRRYNRETLDITWKGLTIADVLELTIEDAARAFANVPVVAGKLETLIDVGLSYVRLGQNATTLSGGEAQRVKLAKELSKRGTGSTLYILDEPTTGLHFHDIAQLLKVLYRLRDQGNTIIVIEHNLDVIRCADWIIDLGPEGGDGGGTVVATGTPEQIAQSDASHTGRCLRPVLAGAQKIRARAGSAS
jgi:excinuclease ABC subunit A